MFGIDRFTAIINPPETAILAVGSAAPRAVVREGAVVARETMTLTLSIDHRAVYGADGALFLARVTELLERPGALVLLGRAMRPGLLVRTELVGYREAWETQRRIAAARAAGEIPDVLWLLEHPPTYTYGRHGRREDLFLDDEALAGLGRRGGRDATGAGR